MVLSLRSYVVSLVIVIFQEMKRGISLNVNYIRDGTGNRRYKWLFGWRGKRDDRGVCVIGSHSKQITHAKPTHKLQSYFLPPPIIDLS